MTGEEGEAFLWCAKSGYCDKDDTWGEDVSWIEAESPTADTWIRLGTWPLIVGSDTQGPTFEYCHTGLSEFIEFSNCWAGGFGESLRHDYTGDGFCDLPDFQLFGYAWASQCLNYNPGLGRGVPEPTAGKPSIAVDVTGRRRDRP